MQDCSPQIAFDSLRWLVVNTHQHRERFAIENLQRQQFTAYCPWVTRQVRHARKTYATRKPMFAGYVFVALTDTRQNWRSLLSTYGIRSIVRCGDNWSTIDGAFIDALRAREVDGAIVRPHRPFTLGQNVRIAHGALDGLIGTIIEMDDKDRLVVLLDMLNRPVKVKLPAAAVNAF